MNGLVEWRLGESFGVQLWSSPDRAGQSTMVLEETDLDVLVSHLNDVGLDRPAIEKVTASRLLQLEDPDRTKSHYRSVSPTLAERQSPVLLEQVPPAMLH